MKKIAIVDPYLDTLGGGERHLLSITQIFDEKNYEIDILWESAHIKQDIATQLNLSFTHLKVVPYFLKKGDFLHKLRKTHEYEYLFYVTDGSYFFSHALHNYVFCMYPQKGLYEASLINRLKWHNFRFISNSCFTQSFIEKWTGKSSEVIYPYIDIIDKTVNKDKIIVSVGRFFDYLHSKRQDILIDSFNKLQQKYNVFKEFKLYMIGGLQEKDTHYFESLQKRAASNPSIIFIPNASHTQIVEYYHKALFFWHAAGYGVDDAASPEKVEHLGIAPLDALGAGCVTFCFKAGELKKLIVDRKNGFLYTACDELIEKTASVFRNPSQIACIQRNAKELIRSTFSYDVFKKHVKDYFAL